MTEERPPHLNDSIERAGQHLLIDDDAKIVGILNQPSLKGKGFLAVCCSSVAKAISAIEQHRPKTLFIDNNLSPAGDEGLEIVKIVKERWPNIQVYSTTNNPAVFHVYEKLGIKHVGKNWREIDTLLKD